MVGWQFSSDLCVCLCVCVYMYICVYVCACVCVCVGVRTKWGMRVTECRGNVLGAAIMQVIGAASF